MSGHDSPPARTAGIHHVTAVASDPQATLEFYTNVLGLRLLKRTVNFDDPSTYHLYFGDEVGTPGSAFTVFPFAGAQSGTPGVGQPTATGFRIPRASVEFWRDRLASADVDADDPVQRFGETVLPFRDHDGQPMELVAVETESGVRPWSDVVPKEDAIRGFHGVTLTVAEGGPTATVLEILGFEETDGDGDRTRFTVSGDGPGTVVDVVESAEPTGRPGAGTVHHVAFRAENEDHQTAIRDAVTDAGHFVTPRKDRQYFQSIYFREPGNVLFEVATDGPGFTRDETDDELGTSLKLPPWLEEDRETIEASLPTLDVGSAEEAR